MPSTLASYREAAELYLRPALGHLRLTDLRDHHFRDLAAAMRKINRPEADADRSDLLRRLLAARAVRDGRRYLDAPADGRADQAGAGGRLVVAGRPRAAHARGQPGRRGEGRQGPQGEAAAWTAPRVERWRETGQVPGRVMVWSAAQCGEFLDGIEGDRLYALYHLAAYFGLRRSELAGLCWSDVDLATRRVHVRQAQVDDELDATKSEDSERIIIIDEGTADVLRAWRKVQLAERMAWAGVWTDSGRVFTREDGTPLRPGGISEQFATVVSRLGLPPVTAARPAARRGDDAARRGPAAEGHQRDAGAQHGRVHHGRLHRGGRGAGRGRGRRHRGVHPAACQDCAKRGPK